MCFDTILIPLSFTVSKTDYMISHKYIFNRKNKLKNDGTALIQLELYDGKKRKYLSTGISVEPKFWNDKNQKVSSNHPRFEEYNYLLIDLSQKIDDVIRKYILKAKTLSLDLLIQLLEHSESDLLVDFIDREVSKDLQNTEKTKTSHLNTKNRLVEYRPDARLDEVNYEFVVGFNNYLISKNYAINTIAKMHKNLKRFLNLAIKYNLISHEDYPYRHFKVKKEETKRESLTYLELKAIEDLKFDEGSIYQQVKDMFLFSCYTGLRISDIIALRSEYFTLVDEGWKLEMKIQKTKKQAYYPLWKFFPLKDEESGKPEFIVWRYYNSKGSLFFPKITEPKINLYLKGIASSAKIKKNVTFHIARHTFGTIMATRVPLPVLQALMQHSEIKTTMVYVHMTNQLLDDNLDNVDWEF